MGKSSTSRFWLYASGGAFLVSLSVRVHGPDGPTQVITEGTVLADFGENRRAAGELVMVRD